MALTLAFCLPSPNLSRNIFNHKILRKCISCNAYTDCNPNLSPGVPVLLACLTQPVDPSSAVTNAMPHHSTAHIMPGEQQMMPENRYLHTAVGVITVHCCCNKWQILAYVKYLLVVYMTYTICHICRQDPSISLIRHLIYT